MKKTWSLFLFLISFLPAFSQQEIKIDEINKPMSKGLQNAFVTEIPQAKMKEVISAWKRYVRHDTRNPVEQNNNEYYINGTVIPNISNNPIHVYAIFLETSTSVRLTSYFTADDSTFMSSARSEEQVIGVKKFLHDFVVQQYKVAVTHELDLERRNLFTMENDMDDLISEKDRASKRINEDNRRIDKLKDLLVINRNEQEARAAEIATQKETVRGLASATVEEKDAEGKKLKALEKQKKKLEKQNENSHTDIEDLESDIQKQERKIDKNADSQKEKKDEIISQKDLVRTIEKKLKNIK